MKNQILTLLNDYASKDETRPNIEGAWLRDGYLRATNGHTLIHIPETLCPEHGIKPKESAPDTDKSISFADRTFTAFDPAIIDVATTPHADEYESVTKGPCPECRGRGQIRCSACNNGWEECSECDGNGLVDYNRLGQPLSGTYVLPKVEFLGRKFNYHYLKLLKRAADLFGGEWQVSLGDATDGVPHSFAPALFTNTTGVKIAIMEIRP